MSGTTIRCQFRAPRQPPVPAGPTRVARMLALAHHIERLVDDGTIESYAGAARVLGLTRARMTQVMNLLLLAPGIQERIVLGDVVLVERSLRRVFGEPDWGVQEGAVAGLPE